MKTTVGQVLVNDALPPEQRDYTRVWDKKTAKQVLAEVARNHPEKYAETTLKLMRAGQSAAITSNYSFSLDDFTSDPATRKRVRKLREQVQRIADNDGMTEKQKDDAITTLLGGAVPKAVQETLERGLARGSRLAKVVASGAKGNPSQYNTTVGTPLMFVDAQDKPIPVPVLHSISEGLDPAEYWAGSYGTRRGVISTKFATREAGYFGKKLALAAQRGVVAEDDCETANGLQVRGDDPENTGTILQTDVAGLKAGTLLRPEHLKKLKGTNVVVRSPMTCQAKQGVCSKCAGIRETGTFPAIGDNIGITSAQSLGEKLSQMMLSTKHGAGAAGAKREYGFSDVENLFEMPEHNTLSAAVANVDGTVQKIDQAPQGGVYVTVGGEDHWAPSLEDVRVKQGQRVEAGDVLTRGIPNPKEVARHRGIGDARKVFMESLLETAGGAITRRNAEVMSRAVVSHVRAKASDPDSGVSNGDVVRYDDLVRTYRPRETAKTVPLPRAKNTYLEQPALHYTIGTKVTDRVAKDLKSNGVKSILTNEEPPWFEPDVQRLYAHSQVDPDWMVRMSGYRLKENLLKGVHAGDVSEQHSTSYVPSLASGVEFGDQLKETGLY